MAWVNPRTWSAGETVTAAFMNTIRDSLKAIGDPWTVYTPTLANWGLGNGTLTGRYMQAGKLVRVTIDFTSGSTTTYSGNWAVSLPVSRWDSSVALPFAGQVWLMDNSPATNNYSIPLGSGTSSLIVRSAAGVTVNATSPWTWATGDRIYADFSYEAA